MTDDDLNEFVEDGIVGLEQVSSSPVERDEYAEPQSKNGDPLRILFLSSDSICATKRFVAKRAKEFARGKLVSHKKNVCEISNISEDEHLLASFEDSFKAGGNRALAGVLEISEEEHAIQSAVDVNENAYFDKHFNVRVTEVAQRMKDSRPDVLHFSGHIEKDCGFVFCRRDSSTSGEFKNEYMKKEDFLSCFKGMSILLAIIASCNSAEIAKSLVEVGAVKIAIGANAKIEDNYALLFVENFYKELARIGNMTNADFLSSVQKAYSIAAKSVQWQRCPMCIYPEIREAMSPIKRIKNQMRPMFKQHDRQSSELQLSIPNRY